MSTLSTHLTSLYMCAHVTPYFHILVNIHHEDGGTVLQQNVVKFPSQSTPSHPKRKHSGITLLLSLIINIFYSICHVFNTNSGILYDL
jgi:hypothetical protein